MHRELACIELVGSEGLETVAKVLILDKGGGTERPVDETVSDADKGPQDEVYLSYAWKRTLRPG